MNITVFLALMAASGIFYLTAATSNDKRFLIGASGILIIISAMLLTGGTLKYPSGTDTVVENVSTDKTFKNQTTVYSDINTAYNNPQKPTTHIALILIVVALYGLYVGVYNTKGFMPNRKR